jgi:DNA-binding LacI/PurR family transcriptional regulator
MALTKHQLIHNDIRTKITRGDLAPGAPLPSQQELMATYGVAQGTVRQALDRLQADGLVTAQRGKGTYVNHHAPVAKSAALTTIGLVAIGNKERFTVIHDSFLHLQRSIARHGFELAVRFFDVADAQDIIQWSQKHAGVIIWSAANVTTIDKLIALGVPTAILGELLDGPCPNGASWIHYNVDDTVAMAVNLLKSMGHQRIWFVSRRGTQYYDWLARAFAEQTQAASIANQCDFIDLPLIQDEPNLMNVLEAASSGAQPTALLIEGDMRACRLIHLLEKAKWPVPERLSVMAIGASDPDRLGVRELYRVITPPDIGVERSVDALVETIRTGRVVRHVIAPRLDPGTTCVPRVVSPVSRP